MSANVSAAAESGPTALAWAFIQKTAPLGVTFCTYAAPENAAAAQPNKITAKMVAILREHPAGINMRLTREELAEAAFTFLFEPLDLVENHVRQYLALRDHALLQKCRSFKRAIVDITLNDSGGRYGRFLRSSLVARIDRFYDEVKSVLPTPAQKRDIQRNERRMPMLGAYAAVVSRTVR